MVLPFNLLTLSWPHALALFLTGQAEINLDRLVETDEGQESTLSDRGLRREMGRPMKSRVRPKGIRFYSEGPDSLMKETGSTDTGPRSTDKGPRSTNKRPQLPTRD